MAEFLATIENSWIAESLRFGRWNHAAVNALHILGISILVGASLPLAFRMIGFRRDIPLPLATSLLIPSAIGGAVLAVLMGDSYSPRGRLNIAVCLSFGSSLYLLESGSSQQQPRTSDIAGGWNRLIKKRYASMGCFPLLPGSLLSFLGGR